MGMFARDNESRAECERRHTRVNWYLTAGLIASSGLFGYGCDVELAVIAAPGLALAITALATLCVRND